MDNSPKTPHTVKLLDTGPQTSNHSNNNGSYTPILRLDNYLLNAGEDLIIDVFISGYGKITDSKLFFAAR